MNLYRILADSIEVLAILVAVFGIFNYKKFSKELLPVFYFVAFGAVTEILTDFYKKYVDKVNMPLGHFYLTISIIILVYFYQGVLGGYVRKKVIWFCGFLYIIYAVINPLLIQSVKEFPNILGASGAILIVVFSILLFAKIMTEAKIDKLQNEPVIWINSAFLLYYTGNFFYYMLFNINVTYFYSFARHTVIFYNILNIALYVLIGISFFKIRRKTKLR